MKKAELEAKFIDYCKVLNLTIERSYFLETPGTDREYIAAKPGTVFLQHSDPRAGNLWAISQNGERGTVSTLYGFANIYQVYGYMDGIIKCKNEMPQSETFDDFITFRDVVSRFPSLMDKDYKKELFSDVMEEFGYKIKEGQDYGNGEYSDFKGYLNVELYEITE